MSYGEPVQTPVGGRFGEIIKEFVNKHGVRVIAADAVQMASLHTNQRIDAFNNIDLPLACHIRSHNYSLAVQDSSHQAINVFCATGFADYFCHQCW